MSIMIGERRRTEMKPRELRARRIRVRYFLEEAKIAAQDLKDELTDEADIWAKVIASINSAIDTTIAE